MVLADGKPVLRDLAKWMKNQKKGKRDKLDPLREEMLNSIGFPFYKRNKRRQTDPSSSSSSSTTTSRKKKRTISDYYL